MDRLSEWDSSTLDRMLDAYTNHVRKQSDLRLSERVVAIADAERLVSKLKGEDA